MLVVVVVVQYYLRWIRDPNSSVRLDMSLIVCTLKSHIDVMRQALFRSGDGWDRSQRLASLASQGFKLHSGDEIPPRCAAAQRTYRLVEEYDGLELRHFLDTTKTQMESTQFWDVLPRNARTQRVRTRCFKHLARGRARMVAEKRAQTNYPRKLVASVLDESGSLAAAVLDDAKCPRRLCPWSRSFVEFHKADITCADAKAELHGVGEDGRGEDVAIERSHAVVRRFLTRKSVQSKAVDLQSLQGHWVVSGLQFSGASRRDMSNNILRKWRRASQSQLPALADAPQQGSRKRKLSRWDIFRGQQAVGLSLAERPKQKEVARLYRALLPDELEELDKMLHDCNEAKSEGQYRAFISGAKRRRLETRPPSQALQLVAQDSLAELDLQDARERCAEVKLLTAMTTHQHRDEDRACEKCLDSYQDIDAPGGQDRQRTLEAIPSLSDAPGDFNCLPCSLGGLVSAHYDASPALEKAKEIAKSRSRWGVDQLHKCMEREWDVWSQTVQHAETPVVTAACKAPLTRRLCFEANMCLCDTWGINASRISRKLIKTVFGMYPKDKGMPWRRQRSRLKDGDVVLLLFGSVLRDTEDDGFKGVCQGHSYFYNYYHYFYYYCYDYF